MADFPEFPDAGEPCINNTTLVLVATCVNGLRVIGWASSSELGTASALANSVPCGGCGKAEVVKAMVEKGWQAKDIAAVLKAMG